jgi:hypothetical protein
MTISPKKRRSKNYKNFPVHIRTKTLKKIARYIKKRSKASNKSRLNKH